MRAEPIDVALAYERRWERVDEAAADLALELAEAETVWGNRITDAAKPMIACLEKLRLDLSRYLRAIADDDFYKILGRERMGAIEAVVYALPGEAEHDQFGIEISKAAKLVEASLQPYIHT